MRAPTDRRVVLQRSEPAIELVWFESDRQLAVYALDALHVALAAPGLTARELRPGHWLGEVSPASPNPLQAEHTVGEQVLAV